MVEEAAKWKKKTGKPQSDDEMQMLGAEKTVEAQIDDRPALIVHLWPRAMIELAEGKVVGGEAAMLEMKTGGAGARGGARAKEVVGVGEAASGEEALPKEVVHWEVTRAKEEVVVEELG